MSGTPPSTPKAKATPLSCPDTVPRLPHASQSGYRTGDLAQGRRAVLNDLKKYLQVDYEQLLRSRFGTYPDKAKLAEMRRKLQADGLIATGGDKWSKFADSPSTCKAVAFQPFKDIVSTILEKTPKTSFVFEMTPNETPISTRRNTSRPDAFVRRKELWHPDNKTHWFDIAIPLEFKKSVSDRQDNERKVIWSLHNIMREDPLRRFAFGITIEGTDLRIWCIDRALLAVSTPINVTTEINHVIVLFLLHNRRTWGSGGDPTVKRNKDGRYVFTISGKKYATIRGLSTFGADVTVSRATRVYEAKDEDGNIVAIKDSWRDSTREHEGSIVEKIHEDIKSKFGKEEAEKAKKYFVGVRTYEDVQITGQLDKTLDPGKGGTWIEINGDPFLSQRLHLPSTGHIPDSGYQYLQHAPFPTAKEDVKIPCRVHARIVFKDVGKPVTDVRVLNDCFSCLCDALKALYYLHLSGWVHRDFSVTNVLWVKDKLGSFTGKLTDFEFAKRVDSEISHEVRAGTIHFMAIEVERLKYLFLPPVKECLDLSTMVISTPPFRMNPVHDVESVWWAVIWILFYYTDSSDPAPASPQMAIFNMAFPGMINQAPRKDFFMDSNEQLSAYSILSKSYSNVGWELKQLASTLQTSYTSLECSDTLLSDCDLEQLLNKALSLLEAAKKRLETLIQLNPSRPEKRNADDASAQSNKKAKQST